MLPPAKPKDQYPWGERRGLTFLPFPFDYVTEQAVFTWEQHFGFGTKWWDPINQKLNHWDKDNEQHGNFWFRMMDHIGERKERVNKMPLSSFVDMERGNFAVWERQKSNYCNHLNAKYRWFQRQDNRNKTAEHVYWEHLWLSCYYQNTKLAGMEHERLRRLHEAGVFDAIKERTKWSNKMPYSMMTKYDFPQEVDFNRFRDSDNTWETYHERKAKGEFIKNPQTPDTGMLPKNVAKLPPNSNPSVV